MKNKFIQFCLSFSILITSAHTIGLSDADLKTINNIIYQINNGVNVDREFNKFSIEDWKEPSKQRRFIIQKALKYIHDNPDETLDNALDNSIEELKERILTENSDENINTIISKNIKDTSENIIFAMDLEEKVRPSEGSNPYQQDDETFSHDKVDNTTEENNYNNDIEDDLNSAEQENVDHFTDDEEEKNNNIDDVVLEGSDSYDIKTSDNDITAHEYTSNRDKYDSAEEYTYSKNEYNYNGGLGNDYEENLEDDTNNDDVLEIEDGDELRTTSSNELDKDIDSDLSHVHSSAKNSNKKYKKTNLAPLSKSKSKKNKPKYKDYKKEYNSFNKKPNKNKLNEYNSYEHNKFNDYNQYYDNLEQDTNHINKTYSTKKHKTPDTTYSFSEYDAPYTSGVNNQEKYTQNSDTKYKTKNLKRKTLGKQKLNSDLNTPMNNYDSYKENDYLDHDNNTDYNNTDYKNDSLKNSSSEKARLKSDLYNNMTYLLHGINKELDKANEKYRK